MIRRWWYRWGRYRIVGMLFKQAHFEDLFGVDAMQSRRDRRRIRRAF